MERESLLKEMRDFWVKNSVPNISDINAQFLWDLIKIKKASCVLEIGTANWFSTIHLGIGVEKNTGKLIWIEFSLPSFELAQKNIIKARLEDTVEILFWDALEIIPWLEQTFDFVFIDGMMKSTKDFLELVWDRVETGGVIIIDDVIKFKKKMIWLDTFLETHKIAHNILPIDGDDGVMMIIKP